LPQLSGGYNISKIFLASAQKIQNVVETDAGHFYLSMTYQPANAGPTRTTAQSGGLAGTS
jgi:hypothetical protein